MFAIKSEYRSKGIGQRMMDLFYDISRREGFESVILEVRETNIRAQKLYARNGFVKIGEIKGLYVSGELAYRLQRDL